MYVAAQGLITVHLTISDYVGQYFAVFRGNEDILMSFIPEFVVVFTKIMLQEIFSPQHNPYLGIQDSTLSILCVKVIEDCTIKVMQLNLF